MNYFKFIGDAEYKTKLVPDLQYENLVIALENYPDWISGNPWQELSKVELLIEMKKGITIVELHKGDWIRRRI